MIDQKNLVLGMQKKKSEDKKEKKKKKREIVTRQQTHDVRGKTREEANTGKRDNHMFCFACQTRLFWRMIGLQCVQSRTFSLTLNFSMGSSPAEHVPHITLPQ